MAWDRQSVLERCAISAATAWGFYLLARFVNGRWLMTALQQQLQETQASLEHERVKRTADRVGRIRAEQELRAVKVQLQRLQLQQQLQPEATAIASSANGDTQSDLGETALPLTKTTDGASGPAGPPQPLGREADETQQNVQHQGARGKEQRGRGDMEAAIEGASEPKSPVASAATGGLAGHHLDAKRNAAVAAAALAAAGSAMPAFPFRPIGHLQSVFTERNGTPRQPQLVPAARARLVLCNNVPPACLEGLHQYTHCWVLYVFHANTDLAKYLSTDRSGLKAKIHVPRLNGARMGVLATRSPHRPSPIGLSTARIIGLEGNSLLLGGADIVDGSPVLDIKPYVPFCDCLPAAKAPSWVQAEAEEEPLAVREVVMDQTAQDALMRAWQARKAHSMYSSAEQYLELVRQVLSRDIRSVHQRLNVRPTSAAQSVATAGPTTRPKAPTPPLLVPRQLQQPQPDVHNGVPGSSVTEGVQPGEYHVVLENVYISYDIGPSGVVQVYNAWVDPITAR
ncbi:hypothetical protein VaNZ11_009717 [Volvox africanus]|uniref:TsaA-like domain-containing protein n=1 Tax=Volvox africanus TaxID=51714 RepID=A0ABQ5S896_9CHLO|nr:hypothetical protein VaNZ11_009717 [Volvox africanus]